jgi:hypothetical protein
MFKEILASFQAKAQTIKTEAGESPEKKAELQKKMIVVVGIAVAAVFLLFILPSGKSKSKTAVPGNNPNSPSGLITPELPSNQNPLTSEEKEFQLSDKALWTRKLEDQMEKIRIEQKKMQDDMETLQKEKAQFKEDQIKAADSMKKEIQNQLKEEIKKESLPSSLGKPSTGLELPSLTGKQPGTRQVTPATVSPVKIEKFNLARANQAQGAQETPKITYIVIPPYSEATGELASGVDASVDLKSPRPVVVKITSPWQLSNGQMLHLEGMRLLCKAVAMGSEERIDMQVVGVSHILNEDNPTPFDNSTTFKSDQEQGVGYLEDREDGKFGVKGVLHSKIPEKTGFTAMASLISALGSGFKAYNTTTMTSGWGTTKTPTGDPLQYAGGEAAEAIGNSIAKDLEERRNLFQSYVSVEQGRPVKIYLMRRLEFDESKYEIPADDTRGNFID